SSTPKPGNAQTAPNNQPNNASTSANPATATAEANLIVADSLNGPIHSWPNTQNGTGNDRGNYVFQNGEYHITATSDKTVAAVALLPDITVSNPFVYKISLSEVNGLDDSTDAKKVNTFGVIFRFYQQDEQHLSYYAFLINPNKAKPSYEFQKYDSFH